MSGLVFQPDIDQQVQMLAKTLISRPNIEQQWLINPILATRKRRLLARSRIERLMKDIKIAPATNNLTRCRIATQTHNVPAMWCGVWSTCSSIRAWAANAETQKKPAASSTTRSAPMK